MMNTCCVFSIQVDTLANEIEQKIAELDSQLLDYKNLMTKMRDCPSKSMMKRKAVRLLKRKRLYRNQAQSLRMNAFKMKQAECVSQGIVNMNTKATAVPKIKKNNLITEKLSLWYKKIFKQNK